MELAVVDQHLNDIAGDRTQDLVGIDLGTNDRFGGDNGGGRAGNDDVIADLAASRAEGTGHPRWMALSKFVLDVKLIETRLMVDLMRLATGRGKDDENDQRKSS